MKQQIRLEKWTTTKDANGNNSEGVIKYNSWAEITDMNGSRLTLDGQSQLKTLMKFVLYFRPDFKISGNWKIIYNGSKYSIQNISQVDQRRFFWEIIGEKIDES